MVEQEVDWLAVLGRASALTALHFAGLREMDLATQGVFLEKLGLPRKEAALLVGTTTASLTELLRQARVREASRGDRKTGKSGKR